jgi:hypothetical protein
VTLKIGRDDELRAVVAPALRGGRASAPA